MSLLTPGYALYYERRNGFQAGRWRDVRYDHHVRCRYDPPNMSHNLSKDDKCGAVVG